MWACKNSMFDVVQELIKSVEKKCDS
jgi:hypothetical protein